MFCENRSKAGYIWIISKNYFAKNESMGAEDSLPPFCATLILSTLNSVKMVKNEKSIKIPKNAQKGRKGDLSVTKHKVPNCDLYYLPLTCLATARRHIPMA